MQVHVCRRRVTTKWIPSQADWLTGISSHFKKKLLSEIEKKKKNSYCILAPGSLCWRLDECEGVRADRYEPRTERHTLSGRHDGGKSRAWRRDQHDEIQSQRSLTVLCKCLIVCLGTKQYLVQTGFVVPWIGTKLSVKLGAEWRNITILQKAASTMSRV